MIGTRLKLARSSSGLSLRDLAERMGNVVSAQAIGKYERNEDMPGSRALMALATALGVSESYLLSDEELTLEGVDFRKKRSAKEEATIEARTLQLLERYLAIEELLGLKSIEWDRPRNAPYPVKDFRDAEDAARSVREAWGLGYDPIPKFAELLEERGIKVLSIDLDDIDGLAACVTRKGRDAARVIVVRRIAWAERKRFTLAHELGHMVMAVVPGLDEEKAAHRFAGALLMPADVMHTEVGTSRSSISLGELVALKKRFGVSVQAIAFRCRDLGILDQKAFSSLFRLFSARGWRTYPYAEPECISPDYEEPKRFERLCYRALAEGVIGESRASEMLGISLADLDKQLENAM
ncbi:MAG: ImmA/IrrE family metallo-endopeptidase [Alphaproteobacteria bacterium]|jgi:Zn-dependent peptidase ImmA (M78 family)/DNA-binding XRE family transcriptional regulator|nr:MAG: ImmA/IrrE family metallo-endopeptidase [Dechloromonas sp.]MBN9529844.1 ImmA/IrrE family metallo-endopeptidase [Alphaproteobacteria bacterium]